MNQTACFLCKKEIQTDRFTLPSNLSFVFRGRESTWVSGNLCEVCALKIKALIEGIEIETEIEKTRKILSGEIK